MAHEPSTNTSPGCVALIITPRREIILQLRDDKPGICWPGYWSLPGGRQEPRETPQETILREIKEETGIIPDTLRQVTVTPHAPGKRPPHVFLGTWNGTQADLVCGEGQDLQLFALDGLPSPMPPHISHYIHQLAVAHRG